MIMYVGLDVPHRLLSLLFYSLLTVITLSTVRNCESVPSVGLYKVTLFITETAREIDKTDSAKRHVRIPRK